MAAFSQGMGLARSPFDISVSIVYIPDTAVCIPLLLASVHVPV
jgi:hypothetical protein